MTWSPVRSTGLNKLARAARLVVHQGPAELFRKLREYFVYHLDSKWHFVYLGFALEKEFSRIPESSKLTVRVAEEADLPRIERELFPEMTGEQEDEKKYFGLIGTSGICCFVAERDGRLVHYSWVFLNASASPIIDTPFKRSLLRVGDSYVGPVFTVPGARGFIYPQVLANIVRYLKGRPGLARIVVLVQGKNPAAVSFYKRMDFAVIENAHHRPAWSRLAGVMVEKFL